MSRVSSSALVRLQPLLDELDRVPGLVQVKPAIFYCRRLPMLHFHETEHGTSDATIVADLKCVVPVPSGFDRMTIANAADKKRLIKAVTARCETLLAPRAVKPK